MTVEPVGEARCAECGQPIRRRLDAHESTPGWTHIMEPHTARPVPEAPGEQASDD